MSRSRDVCFQVYTPPIPRRPFDSAAKPWRAPAERRSGRSHDWSIPKMSLLSRHPGRSALCAALILAFIGILCTPAPSQVPDKLPAIKAATHKAYTEKLAEGVEFEMIPIPGGVFMMGSP